MGFSTHNPISLNHVADPENAPDVIEGDLKIYFETEEHRSEYLKIPLHGSEDSSALNRIYDDVADDPATGRIN